MWADILLGAVGLASTGVSALVLYRRNADNGDGHAPEAVPEAAPLVPPQHIVVEFPTARFNEAMQPLAALPKQLETRFDLVVERLAAVLEAQLNVKRAPPPEPAWPRELERSFAGLVSRLEALEASRLKPVEQPQLTAIAAGLACLTERLETFIELPAPPLPPVELPQVSDLTAQIRELVDVERMRAAAKPEYPPTKDGGSAVGPSASPTKAPPDPRAAKPITRAAGPVILDEYNTITLDEYVVYELQAPESGIFSANILNLGPGWLYLRANAEPTIADPKATALPPGAIDNEVRVGQRIYALASEDGMITVRLAH